MSTAAVQTPAPYASASLYVGDLNPDITEALLYEVFSQAGTVASVRVCRDAATRRSLGYAYVNFHRVDDAERALDTMNFNSIRGRPCRIMWSHRDPSLRKSGVGNIFVKNLNRSIDNKTLYDTFSRFGNILSCKVACDSKGNSLGYGFIHFESDEVAQAAIDQVNDKVILGEKVTVQPFKSKRERGATDKSKFTNVFVKNLPDDITKEKMEDMFKKFGTITSSMLAMEEKDSTSKPRGYGFVNFEKPEQAQAAVEEMQNFELNGKKLYVGRAQKKEEREKELREKFEALKAARAKQYQGVNLYVKNLADSIDDNRLTQEFSKFGNITSAKVMQDRDKKSKGFGFVCFTSPEDATKAVTEMNNHMLEGKPLYVALAQRKEVRRAHLEQLAAARSKMAVPTMYAPQGPNPMFYQNNFYSAQMMMRPRGPWGPQQQASGPMMGVNVGVRTPMGFQLMPVNNSGRGNMPPQQPPMQGGRGGRGRGGSAGRGGLKNGIPQQQPGMVAPNGRGRAPPSQGQPAPNYKYTPNARNQQVPPMAAPQAALTPTPPQALEPQVDADSTLTVKALAQATEEQRKQMLGEKLFPLIQAQQPQLAGKITGMLLEMENGELLHLLVSESALNDKIQEALEVLRKSGLQDGDLDGVPTEESSEVQASPSSL